MTRISIPLLRDYHRINREITVALDAGIQHLRLEGAAGQRFLAAGLAGPWTAVIEIEGQSGLEVAAGLDAPDLLVVCHGGAGDGAGSMLQRGCLLIRGDTGTAAGYSQRGGAIVIQGHAGPRAGLRRRGGLLVALAGLGLRADEQTSGGRLLQLTKPAPGDDRGLAHWTDTDPAWQPIVRRVGAQVQPWLIAGR